jgi:prepilin-type N-terminal cleavage/methylation domain-containing protein
MKRAFTLIEMIFVIVIIGLLAAIAVPKFVHLQQNAEATPLLEVLSDINGSGIASSYLNAVELNGIREEELNLSQFIKMKGPDWKIYVRTNPHTGKTQERNATYREGHDDLNATFFYNDGYIKVRIYCNTSTRDGKAIQHYLQRYGYNCTQGGKTFKFYIATQHD